MSFIANPNTRPKSKHKKFFLSIVFLNILLYLEMFLSHQMGMTELILFLSTLELYKEGHP